MPEIESLINQYPTFRLLKDGLLCSSAFNSKQVASRLNQNLNLKSDSVVTQGLDWIKIRCLSCRIVAKTDTHQRREEHRSHPFTISHPRIFDNGSCLESSKCGGVVWSVLLISEGLRKHESWLPEVKYLGISKDVYICPKSPMDVYPTRSHHPTQAKLYTHAYSAFTMCVQKSTAFGLCSRGG